MKSHRCYLLLLFLLVTVSNVAAQDDLTRVSEHSPFANCAVLPLPGEISYVDAEVEPWIAIDPRNPNHLVGVWQQRLAQEVEAGGEDRQFAGLGQAERAFHTDQVAEVEELCHGPAGFTDLLLGKVDLDAAGPILDLEEMDLAHLPP